jgi:hypothetical protein
MNRTSVRASAIDAGTYRVVAEALAPPHRAAATKAPEGRAGCDGDLLAPSLSICSGLLGQMSSAARQSARLHHG